MIGAPPVCVLALPALAAALWFSFPPLSDRIAISFSLFCGFLAFFLLCLAGAVSPRRSGLLSWKGKAFIRRHRFLAVAVVALAAAHGGAFLLAEPVSWRYLSVQAPYPMIGGIFAFLFLAACLSQSLSVAEIKYLHRNARYFRVIHIFYFIAAVMLSTFHAVGSGHHVDTGARAGIVLACGLAALLAPLLNRLAVRSGPGGEAGRRTG